MGGGNNVSNGYGKSGKQSEVRILDSYKNDIVE